MSLLQPHKPEPDTFGRPIYTPSSPPSYGQDEYDMTAHRPSSRWDPRKWRRNQIIGLVIGAAVLLIVIVVAAVVGSRGKRYPNYGPLNYKLVDHYSGAGFFDQFDYFTGYDPTQGFVHYVDQPGSQQMNLTYATANSAVMRVDTSETDASTGRKSVRITSKNRYNDGLFIFDVLHAPYGCGTWPALWTSDPSVWPQNGEIDVVEAINTATTGNQMTLHTTNACSMSGIKRKETGSVLSTNCYNGTNGNEGCGVRGPVDTFGAALNSNNGGVYAMELRAAGIRIWFFPRSSPQIATSINNGPLGTSPDPSTWGTSLADFPSTHCSITDHFRNQSIIANIDLCGQWAGQEKLFTQEAQCPGTCTTFVATNPAAFENAYWEFRSFAVFRTS